MDGLLLQDIRAKLQRRYQRVLSVSASLYDNALRHFRLFLKQDPVVSGMVEELRSAHQASTLPKIEHEISTGSLYLGETVPEAAYVGLVLLEKLCDLDPSAVASTVATWGHTIQPTSSCMADCVNAINEAFVEDLYDYLDERLGDVEVVLSLLLKYQHRSEWFCREHLRNLYKQGKELHQQETMLKRDLHAFLFDQGLPIVEEPKCASGQPDVLSLAQGRELVLEAKVWDETDRSQILAAVNQTYAYLKDHQQPSGFLLVYDHHQKQPLHFLTSQRRGIVPCISISSRTIYLLTINILERPSASVRGPVVAYEISEQDLLAGICR